MEFGTKTLTTASASTSRAHCWEPSRMTAWWSVTIGIVGALNAEFAHPSTRTANRVGVLRTEPARLYCVRIQTASGLALHVPEHEVARQSVPVWPLGCHRIVDVRNAKDTGLRQYLRATQPARIATAIEPLVVLECDLGDRKWGLQDPQDLEPDLTVGLDQGVLGIA